MRKIVFAIIILLIFILACGNNSTKVVIKGLDDEEIKTPALQKPTSSELQKTTILFLIKNEQDLPDYEFFALDLKEIMLKSKGISLKIAIEEKKPDLAELKKYSTTKLLSMSKISEGSYDEISFNIVGALYKKTSSDVQAISSEKLSIPVKFSINPKESYAVVLNYFPKDSLRETANGVVLSHKAEVIVYKNVNIIIDSDRTVDLNNAEEVFRKKI